MIKTSQRIESTLEEHSNIAGTKSSQVLAMQKKSRH
jgi:hypothetical protein